MLLIPLPDNGLFRFPGVFFYISLKFIITYVKFILQQPEK
jgi:hypothetical protein